MSRTRKIKTQTIAEVRTQLLNIADSTANVYEDTNDLKAAELALKSYNGAVNAAKVQLMYKKLTAIADKQVRIQKQVQLAYSGTRAFQVAFWGVQNKVAQLQHFVKP